ncbi:MAG: HAD family phosphatase [Acidobacteriota bacterium]
MLRALLFDFNGVLVDDEPVHLRLFRKVLQEEGLELTDRDYFERYLGLDDRGCFGEVLERAGRPASAAAVMRLVVRKASYYQEWAHREGLTFFPGAVELVREAAASGLVLGLVSGALRQEIDQALRQAGIRELFKILIAAEDVVASKPDREGYVRGLEELNSVPPAPDRLIHPHEVLAIEDSPAGIAAAAAAGLVTLGVAQTYSAERLHDADSVVPCLAGLGVERLQKLYAAVSRA